MTASATPSLAFYPKDHLADPAVRACGYEARGLWTDLWCFMHSAPERGVLTMTDRQIARATGGTPAAVRRLLGELEAAGVFDRRPGDNAIVCRRMVREARRSAAELSWPGFVYVFDRADGKVRAGAATIPEKRAYAARQKAGDPSIRVAAKLPLDDVASAAAALDAAGVAGGWRDAPAAGPVGLIAGFGAAPVAFSPPASPPSSPPGGEGCSPPASPGGPSSTASPSGEEEEPRERGEERADRPPAPKPARTKPDLADPLHFARFWAAYPRKTARQDAAKAFAKLVPDEPLVARMLDALGWQARTPEWTKEGGAFVPYPASWLNGRRWEDERPHGTTALATTGPPPGHRRQPAGRRPDLTPTAPHRATPMTEAHAITADAAERVVAGSVLRGPDEVDDARAIVRPDDFACYPCRLVFEAAGKLRDTGHRVDAASVLLALTRDGRAADLGPVPARFEAMEKPAAKERLREAGRVGGEGSGKLPEASTGDTRDKVGAALGVSGRT